MSAPEIPAELKVEGRVNPVGLTVIKPKFDFIFKDATLEHTAVYYQIQVSTQNDFLDNFAWDSEKTEFLTPVANGERCQQIEYAGGLLGTSVYFWRARVWDNEDNVGSWSSGKNYFQLGASGMQNTISGGLNSEAHFTCSFSFEGQSGSVDVPDGCSVNFYNCNIDALTIGSECAIHMSGGSCNYLSIGSGSQFLFEGVLFGLVFIFGARGFFWGGSISDQFEIRDKSKVETVDVVFLYPLFILFIFDSYIKFLRCTATVPKTGVHAVASTVVMSSSNFVQYTQYTIKAENRSFVQITDSHVEGVTDCPALIVSNNSSAIVTQGDGYCEGEKILKSGISVIECSQSSYVKVKDSSLVGSDWADYMVLCKEDSKVELVGDGAVVLEGGDFPCLGCYDNSSISVINYMHVICATREAIDCQRNSVVKIFGLTEKIQSDAVDAIYIRDHSRVEVYDVPLIYAPAGDAVDMSEYCDFVGVNISDKMEGVVDYGILATIHCKAKIENVKVCVGDGEDGIFLEDNCRLIALNGEKIEGKGDNGIEAKTNSHIVVRDYSDEIVGIATDGIHMEDDCSATLLNCAKIRGIGKDGIFMLNDCYCHTRHCDEIIGEGRDGVHGESSCEYTSMKDGKIKGVARDGIYMTDGRFINVRRTEEVRGEGRDGIHADNTNIDVYFLPVLHGDGDKCIYVDNCIGTFESVEEGYGANYGLYEENNSDIRIFRSNIAGASPLSLYMNNSCRLFAKNVEFQIKDAKTVEHCEINLEIVTIYGKFESLENCKHEWLRVKIMDKVLFKDSIYRWKEVEILGDHDCDKCIGKVEQTEVQGNFIDNTSENHFSKYKLLGNITHQGVTTKLKGSEIQGLVGLTTCTLRGENTEIKQITDFSASKVEYAACVVASIEGKNKSSYKQFATESADITLNKSAGEMEGGKTGSVSLTESAFTIKAPEIVGAITLTKGSLEQYGGIVGAVSITDGGFAHQGGTAGAVTVTRGGLIQQGGTIGVVSLSSAAFTGKGGTCGAVSCGSSALELISMNAGAISGTHFPLPGCVPGQVVRVGTDKLYEVFDKNVKRWFDENLEERITKDKKVNVNENCYHRIKKQFELDVGEDASFVSGDETLIHSEKDKIEIAAQKDILISSNTQNINLDSTLTIMIRALGAITTSSPVSITEWTPSWLNISGSTPPILITPEQPDGTEEPSP